MKMKKLILLSILVISVFFSNIIVALCLKYIDWILICKFDVMKKSINDNYGLIIYYNIILPVIIYLVFLFRKNNYILLILIFKIFSMITFMGIDDPMYHLFKQMPVCISKEFKNTVD